MVDQDYQHHTARQSQNQFNEPLAAKSRKPPRHQGHEARVHAAPMQQTEARHDEDESIDFQDGTQFQFVFKDEED